MLVRALSKAIWRIKDSNLVYLDMHKYSSFLNRKKSNYNWERSQLFMYLYSISNIKININEYTVLNIATASFPFVSHCESLCESVRRGTRLPSYDVCHIDNRILYKDSY